MGKDTNIEWTDSTINPTSGCDGCELYRPDADGEDEKATCYAREVHENRLAHSYPDNYAAKFNEVRMIAGRMIQASDWPDLTGKPRKDKPWMDGRPRHIFVGDMGDFLSTAVTDAYIESEILKAVTSKNGQRHIWQWLTKRPERLAYLSNKWGGLPDNVVAMTTVTNQRTADVRIPQLLSVKAKTRGLSIEPMRGPVGLGLFGTVPRDISRSYCLTANMLHWVIVGGESGHRAGPMHPDWARSLRDQCQSAGVAFFFKQWGEWTTAENLNKGGRLRCASYDGSVWNYGTQTDKQSENCHADDSPDVYHVGKAAAGRLLDGVEHNEMPGDSK